MIIKRSDPCWKCPIFKCEATIVDVYHDDEMYVVTELEKNGSCPRYKSSRLCATAIKISMINGVFGAGIGKAVISLAEACDNMATAALVVNAAYDAHAIELAEEALKSVNDEDSYMVARDFKLWAKEVGKPGHPREHIAMRGRRIYRPQHRGH